MPRFAPEGYPFILTFVVITLLAAVFMPLAASVPAAAALFMLYFFRDPKRRIPDEKDIFVAPADGKIIVAGNAYEPTHLKTDSIRISIFMSPLNVHVNRSPCDGKVRTVRHNAGGFMAAYRDEASIRNENIEMLLETKYGPVLVRQVAGFVARRAVCRRGEGDILLRGERYGIIKFSSRVDVFLPAKTVLKVSVGDRVKAGESVIGRI